MKNLFIAMTSAALLALGACGNSNTTEIEKPDVKQVEVVETNISDAKLAAVYVYADWCGSCKILDPKVDHVRATTQFPHTAFVTLDYTKKDKAAFYSQARDLNIANAVKSHMGDKIKTGQLLLVDLDDKKVIGVIKKDMSEKDMASAITSATQAA